MPALIPTDYYGDIVWLGIVPPDAPAIQSVAVSDLTLTYGGPVGDRHYGETRPSCSRVVSQYPRGTDIRNARQVSILSVEELDLIAEKIGQSNLDPALLGATIVLRGIPDFSHVPPSARLQAEDGTCLTIDMQNRPCHLPAREISTIDKDSGQKFKTAAKGLRGVTAWVEREGRLAIGQKLRLHIPDQRAWSAT